MTNEHNKHSDNSIEINFVDTTAEIDSIDNSEYIDNTTLQESTDEIELAMPLPAPPSTIDEAIMQNPEKAGQELKSSVNQDEYDDFIFTKYHGRKKSIFQNTTNHNNSSYSSQNHFVKEAHYKKRKRPLWQKLLIILGIILAALAALAIIAIGVFFILKQVGISQLTGDEVNMTAPIIENAGVSVDNSANTITYNGTTYVYNSNMTSILCMGVDKYELGLDEDVVGTGGQADALYMVAIDTNTGKTDIIAISRDIYSDIGVYSAAGQYIGTENAQLCLAYAYGDGMEKSCENTVDAVSRLFYNLPISSYFSIELSAIGELNDAVGGVTVTMVDNYLYHAHGMPKAGETARLVGEQARWFLQYREVSQLESSVDRMNRQITYLKGFGKNAVEMTKQDFTTPITLYNIVKDYSVTNLTTAKISALGYTVATSGIELEFSKVPGEVTSNGTYAEYIVDEQGLLELILDVYYTPVN